MPIGVNSKGAIVGPSGASSASPLPHIETQIVLGPCPFCAAKPHTEPLEVEKGCWRIECWTCCAKGPIETDAGRAIKMWNRGTPAVVSAPLKPPSRNVVDRFRRRRKG